MTRRDRPASTLPFAIGVNVHVVRNGRTMSNARLVAGIVTAGFRYVRLGTHADDLVEDDIEVVNGLTAAGVECTWVFNDSRTFLSAAPYFSHPALHVAFEGFNENSFGYAAAVDDTFTLDALRRRLGWGHVQLILPSTGGNWDELLQYGPGIPYSSVANLHFYAGTAATIDTPAKRANLTFATAWGQGYQRKWLTENGVRHSSGPPGPPDNDSLMSDVAGGIALVRNALFTVSMPSVERFAIYMISDEPTRYNTGDNATYGLLAADGTPKASWWMFQRLFSLTADPHGGDAAAISYACSLGDDVVAQLPIAHSDGRTFIAFWQFDSAVTATPTGGGQPWNAGPLQLPPPLPVTFTFHEQFSAVRLHRLASVAVPSRLVQSDASVHTNVTADVQILEISR